MRAAVLVISSLAVSVLAQGGTNARLYPCDVNSNTQKWQPGPVDNELVQTFGGACLDVEVSCPVVDVPNAHTTLLFPPPLRVAAAHARVPLYAWAGRSRFAASPRPQSLLVGRKRWPWSGKLAFQARLCAPASMPPSPPHPPSLWRWGRINVGLVLLLLPCRRCVCVHVFVVSRV